MARLTYKHSRWIRWSHWINLPLMLLMIWSGNLIYWANDVYRPFYGNRFYQLFRLDHRLAEGMAVHFALMWLFVINGVLYLSYLMISGEWRERFPYPSHFMEAILVTLHDLGLRKEAPPQGKFNAAQRFAYTGLDLLAVLAVLSGFAIYKPVQLQKLTAVLGGYDTARAIHFACMLAICAFLVVHVVQVIRAGWNNFRSMVAGWEWHR